MIMTPLPYLLFHLIMLTPPRNITFTGSTTQTSGTVLVSVYGWTKNPLIEYYVQEYTSNGKGSARPKARHGDE